MKKKSRTEMRIELEYGGKPFAIVFDGLQYTPRELKKTEKGDVNEDILGFCQGFGNAIDRIVKTGLGESEETLSLKQFVERYEAAAAEMRKLTEPEF